MNRSTLSKSNLNKSDKNQEILKFNKILFSFQLRRHMKMRKKINLIKKVNNRLLIKRDVWKTGITYFWNTNSPEANTVSPEPTNNLREKPWILFKISWEAILGHWNLWIFTTPKDPSWKPVWLKNWTAWLPPSLNF